MNTITYALPDESFTLYLGNEDSEVVHAYIPVEGSNPVLLMPMHCKDASCANFVYCYEKSNENIPGDPTVFSRDTSATLEKGLVYLINRMSKETVSQDNKYADHWAKQVAVWLYLGQVSNAELTTLKTATTLRVTNNMSFLSEQ